MLFTAIVPPCASTIRWATERPSPVPLPGSFVVKNGSNNLREVLLGDSAAVVLDVDAHEVPFARGPDGHAATARHRVERVQDEVHEDLLHERRLPAHRPQVGREDGRHVDVLLVEPVREQREDGSDLVVHVDGSVPA